MKSPLSLWIFLLLSCIADWSAAAQKPLPEDAHWDNRFTLPGVQGNVLAMAFDKQRIFLGGGMQSVGRVVVEGVAELEGKHWRALPDGPQQDPMLLNVAALEMFDHRLYAGGFFTNAGGRPTGGLASWDGHQWSVPGGTNGVVYALKSDEHSLLVGGRFTLPGYTNPVALARLDKHNHWQVLNSELPPCGDDDLICLDSVEQVQLLPNGDAICSIAFGIRQWWGGFSSPYYHLLARCDTQNRWSIFPGPDGDSSGFGYYTLTRFGDALIAAGNFTNPTNPALRNIAQWNGSEWRPLGDGLEKQVYAVAGNERALYALHERNIAMVVGRSVVSRWDGHAWIRMGFIQSTDTYSRLFVGPEDDVFVTGFFAGVDSVVAPGLTHWSGTEWEPMVKGAAGGIAGINNTVLALAEHQGSIYMGGIFLSAGDVLSDGLARWDGQQWHDVSGGIGAWFNRIGSLVSSGDRLFASGAFTNIGGIPAQNIASWDGSRWAALGTGISNSIGKLVWWRSNLYAGGRFHFAGGNAAENIARWDGTTWWPLGEGCNSNVSAMVEWRGDLYVGGRFTSAGGNSVSRLARWDGVDWTDVGSGVTGEDAAPSIQSVNALAVGSDGLYVGGKFNFAGSIPATNIARWDGTNWHSLGQGWSGSIASISVQGPQVFVGGTLTDAAGKTVDGVLRWDGTHWSKLGSGVSGTGRFRVQALLARENDLFVGGRFTMAGGKPSANVARWVERPRLHIAHDSANPPPAPRLHVRGEPGLDLRLESSTDLRTWILEDEDDSDSSEWFVEPGKSPDALFFRTVPDPSPASETKRGEKP